MGPHLGGEAEVQGESVCVSDHTTCEQEGPLLFLEIVLWPSCPTGPLPPL